MSTNKRRKLYFLKMERTGRAVKFTIGSTDSIEARPWRRRGRACASPAPEASSPRGWWSSSFPRATTRSAAPCAIQARHHLRSYPFSIHGLLDLRLLIDVPNVQSNRGNCVEAEREIGNTGSLFLGFRGETRQLTGPSMFLESCNKRSKILILML